MSKINKEQMLEALSLNSIAFNEFLMSIDDAATLESFLVKVMRNDTQRKNARVIKRIHSRLNKVRAAEERDMLALRTWYDVVL